MYEFIRGTLVSKDPACAIVEAGGVGYRLNITAQTFDRLPDKGKEATLLLHHTINAEQGEQRLFGFAEEQERMLFRQLLDVQRIGPSIAMRILSNAGAQTLINAIAGGDLVFLKRLKGVGPKVAERLVVELQEPLSKLGLLKGAVPTPAAGTAGAVGRDAVAALVGLGYKPAMSEKAVAAAMKKLGPGAQAAEVIRAALQEV
ncbi:MAG: Holliday junction branch migration protein RuvA [Planctomycetes bacterium]|nr:Holliday junction branch migration protein RuvA [Planctomycetota bacterium]NUQ34916.1 Holliday junction branch migration protein RuvA [Planctomycetaceae bacterium]